MMVVTMTMYSHQLISLKLSPWSQTGRKPKRLHGRNTSKNKLRAPGTNSHEKRYDELWYDISSLIAYKYTSTHVHRRSMCDAIADTQVREPAVVSHALKTIRRGVSAVGKRAAGSPPNVSLITPENLLAGTCLRYDTSDRGALGAEELRQVKPNADRIYYKLP